jgi:hypothetical protein
LITEKPDTVMVFVFICDSAESKSTNDTGRDQPAVQVGSSSSTSNVESSPSTPNIGEELQVSSQLRKFSFNELKSATRNFRPESILGEGGFGCVFKGWINENGTAPVKPGTGLSVAVKTLNHDGLQGHKEWLVRNLTSFFSIFVFIHMHAHAHMFHLHVWSTIIACGIAAFMVEGYFFYTWQAEVNYLGDLLHPNLVKLIGYCIEDDQRLLVYEFMPRGSLENHLFRSM